ncbi:MAG: SDR family NAD(P)-dependent oxidoreductase [Chitinivibrionales bacterium]|nr:SDR family NAD(P)-dependent oxidoreductase [Chitinivibrionales bacterium]
MNAERRVAVITGAASGIGAEFAHHCARLSYELYLVDRDQDGLANLRKALSHSEQKVTGWPGDLSYPSEVHQLTERINSLKRIDLLVNSAGFSLKSAFLDVDDAELQRIVAVNCTAVVALTQAACIKMKTQGSGWIINLSAIGGLLPGFVGPVYGGTKAFVYYFTLGMFHQMKRHGVYLQALSPGHTRTAIHSQEEKRAIPRSFFVKAAAVVSASWKAAEKRRPVCVPSRRHSLLLNLARIGLGRLVWRGARKIEKLMPR